VWSLSERFASERRVLTDSTAATEAGNVGAVPKGVQVYEA
jgi:hypothetical protein